MVTGTGSPVVSRPGSKRNVRAAAVAAACRTARRPPARRAPPRPGRWGRRRWPAPRPPRARGRRCPAAARPAPAASARAGVASVGSGGGAAGAGWARPRWRAGRRRAESRARPRRRGGGHGDHSSSRNLKVQAYRTATGRPPRVPGEKASRRASRCAAVVEAGAAALDDPDLAHRAGLVEQQLHLDVGLEPVAAGRLGVEGAQLEPGGLAQQPGRLLQVGDVGGAAGERGVVAQPAEAGAFGSPRAAVAPLVVGMARPPVPEVTTASMETAKRRGCGGGVPGGGGAAGVAAASGRGACGAGTAVRVETSGGLTGRGGSGVASAGGGGLGRVTSRTAVGGRFTTRRGGWRAAIQAPATAWSRPAASSEGQKVERTSFTGSAWWPAGCRGRCRSPRRRGAGRPPRRTCRTGRRRRRRRSRPAWPRRRPRWPGPAPPRPARGMSLSWAGAPLTKRSPFLAMAMLRIDGGELSAEAALGRLTGIDRLTTCEAVTMKTTSRVRQTSTMGVTLTPPISSSSPRRPRRIRSLVSPPPRRWCRAAPGWRPARG